jgi:hypothetical protein
MLMEADILAPGSTTSKKVKEKKSGLMEPITRENIKTERSMAMVFICGVTAANSTETGKTIK